MQRLKKTVKRLFFPVALLFIATSFTGAYFSDSIFITGNSFETGSWAVPVSESVIISEFMANPEAVADASGEWFEIYNPTPNPINLNGWKYCDNDCSEVEVINSDLTILSHSYLVFAKNIDSITNGGISVDFQISNLSLTNNIDSVVLYKPDGLGGFTVVDRVDYSETAGWPIVSGESAMLNYLTADNSVMSNWSLSTSTYGSGDKGTPGGPNL